MIATVNGRPIARDRLVNFLLQSHGAEALEQLLGLEAAAMAATKRGLTITRADIDHEQNLTLRRLANPLPSLTPEPFDRPGAEDLLDAVLSARRVSRPEFDLLTRRNAYLRKIVESEQEFTDEQLRMEFQRLYGNRVQVRHIQLATLAEAGRIRERLAAGVDFGELAQRYSAHAVSAADKGLLAPFSAQDDRLPAKFRKVAFSLKPGEVSKAVRIGEWYHLIKLEKVLPPEDRTFEQVRSELEHALRERVTEPEMLELFDRLLDEASIEVYDPALAGAFEKKHARRGR